MIDRSTYTSAHVGGIRINMAKGLSFILIFLNTQVFLGSSGNPLGIDGVQELFYLTLLLWAIGSIWNQQLIDGSVRMLDVYVLLLVLIASIYGSFVAKLTYDQPFIFGIIEERRIFAVLIYFPVRTMFERKWLNMDDFESMVVASAAICALLSIGVLLRIVPTLQEVITSEVSLRAERIALGSSSIAFAIPFIVSSKAAFIRIWRPILLILTLGTLIVIIQSRQLILMSFAATVFVMRGPGAAITITGILVGMYIAILAIPSLGGQLVIILQLFNEIGSDQYYHESWRALSYRYVFESAPQALWGHGSLSPLWRDGFERVIGGYFYLADLGLVGTLFRYGVPGILLYLLWFSLQLRLLRVIPDFRRRVLCSALFFFILVGSPVGAPLEYRGYLSGMLLGMTGYLASLKRAGAKV